MRTPRGALKDVTGREIVRIAALVALGTAAAGVLLEGGFRAVALLEHRGVLTPTLRLPADPPRGQPARLAQIIRRSPNPRIVYELRPGLLVYHEGGVVTTNSGGFRCRDYPHRREPGTFRIVGIGDSIMFGLGVHDEQTYFSRLEARLNRAGAWRRVEVINTAVPGYNTVMEVETLKEKGLAYQPDLVILEFVGNDLDLPNFIRLPPDVWSLRESFALTFVRGRLRLVRAPGGQMPVDVTDLIGAPGEGSAEDTHFLGDPERVPPEYAGMVGWSACEKALRELGALSATHGFRVVLMGWDSIPEERKVHKLARSLGFFVLNLDPLLRRHAQTLGFPDYLSSPLARNPRDYHPSAVGHEYLSETIEAFLRDQGLHPAAAGAPTSS